MCYDHRIGSIGKDKRVKVLIAEDQVLLGNSMKQGLEELGWTVDLARDGEDGIYFAMASDYDVIILDWMLPKMTGIELLKTLRRRGRMTPVLMTTAKGAVNDRVEGLDHGADDYLVKPFEMVELIARINALYRRAHGKGTNTLDLGDLRIDLAAQKVFLFGQLMELTGKEYDLLAALASKHGELVKRISLINLLYNLEGEPDSNSLDVLLARVRKKLAGSSIEIETVRGKGFILRVATSKP